MSKQDAVTSLILETFRLNGSLLAFGDALVAPVGLTSARWQVLGAIALAELPLPVAHIARAMGLTRPAVQRLVNQMQQDGLVRFAPNPNHARAQLVLLTAQGAAAYEAAMQRYAPWASHLGAGLRIKQIETITAALLALRTRLDAAREE